MRSREGRGRVRGVGGGGKERGREGKKGCEKMRCREGRGKGRGGRGLEGKEMERRWSHFSSHIISR